MGLCTWDPSIFLRTLCASCCFIAFKSNLNFFCFLIFLRVFQLCCFVSVLTLCTVFLCIVHLLLPFVQVAQMAPAPLQITDGCQSPVLMGKQVCSCELRTNPLSLSSVFALEWLFLNSRCELPKLWKNTGMGLLGGLLNRISEWSLSDLEAPLEIWALGNNCIVMECTEHRGTALKAPPCAFLPSLVFPGLLRCCFNLKISLFYLQASLVPPAAAWPDVLLSPQRCRGAAL